MPKTFRSVRSTQPPTPFNLVFEVPEVEKVQVQGRDDDDGPLYEEQETGNWVEETREFHAMFDRIPGGIVLDVQDMDEADPASGARQARAIRGLIRAAVVEHGEFLDLLDSPRTVVQPLMVGEIVNWLIEGAAARPTKTP